jgi:hypothetical protein
MVYEGFEVHLNLAAGAGVEYQSLQSNGAGGFRRVS